MIRLKAKNNLFSVLVIALVIIYLAFISFEFHNGFFIWDDKSFLFNKLITSENFVNIFIQHHNGLYHPITTFWVKINYLVSGNNPIYLHVFSSLIHIINSLILLRILSYFNLNYVSKFVGLLIFLFHPLNIEVVVWLTCIKDLVLLLFTLLSILYYIKYIKNGNRSTLFIVFLFYIFAILSKPQSIILPLVFILLDYIFEKKINLKVIINKIPFLFLGLIILGINLYVREEFFDRSSMPNFGLLNHIQISVIAFSSYIIESFLPLNLSVFYLFPDISNSIFLKSAPYFLILFLLLGLIVYLIIKKNKIGVGLILMAVAFLLPVIHIIPIGASLINDRYVYSFLIPFSMLIALFTEYLFKINRKIIKFSFLIFLSLFVLNLLIQFQYRLSIWGNNTKILANDYNNHQSSEILANSLGSALYNENKIDSAIHYFEVAIRLDTSYSKAYYNLGVAYQAKNQDIKAIKEYEKAIKNNSNFVLPIINIITINFGNSEYQKCIDFQKNYSDLLDNNAVINDITGKSLYELGYISESILCFKKACALDNNNSIFLYNLAISYGKLNDFEKSIIVLNQSISINPKFKEAYYLRGLAKIYSNQNGCEDFEKSYLLGNIEALNAINKFCKNSNY